MSFGELVGPHLRQAGRKYPRRSVTDGVRQENLTKERQQWRYPP